MESLGKATMDRLTGYRWPGNVRELENILERAVILSNGPTLEIDPEVFASVLADSRPDSEPPTTPPSESEDSAADAAKARPPESLESNMRKHILTALETSNWVIDGPHGAAKALALHPNTLRSRMKKLGIVRAAPQGDQ
jgi:formate hydrogenlyase transcriptional activator